jgi:hypothetical protein
MALGSTQPLMKMSTRNISGGKGGRYVRLTTSPPSRAECREIWEPKSPGAHWATPGLLWDSFTFTFTFTIYVYCHTSMTVSVKDLHIMLPCICESCVYCCKEGRAFFMDVCVITFMRVL